MIASVSREPISAELISAVKSPAPETASAAATSTLSLSVSSAAAASAVSLSDSPAAVAPVSSLSVSLAAAPDGSSLSLEDDELLKSSYTKRESIRMLFLLKNKVLWLNT